MPIKSYLAQPCKGKKDELVANLKKFAGCEIMPSLNEELVVIVTETADKKTDDVLYEQLNKLESLKMLSLVCGFKDE